MTLEQYWSILVRQWKIVVLTCLLVGMGAFIGGKLMKPLYQSSALVQVVISTGTSDQANYSNLSASNLLMQTEATLAVSTPVLREVASHYPNLTERQLAGEVTTTPEANTQLFEIDVVDPSPTRAANLANDIAATLIKQQLQGIQGSNTTAQKELQQNIDQISKQIDDITTKIASLNAQGGNQGQVALLQSQLSELQLQESQLQTTLLQLKQAQAVNYLQVAQSGEPALSPVQPNIFLYSGAGLLTGLLLGMLLALLFELLDTRVRTPEALSQMLNVPVLATVWLARSSKKEDVLNPTAHDVNIESYRILRTNLGFSSIDRPLHSLMVTSALRGEGKSAIAANLAIFMAKVGKSSLLIDADLRRPTQGELFGLSADKMGLSNALLAMGTLLTAHSGSTTLAGTQDPERTQKVMPTSSQLRSTTIGVPSANAPSADFSLAPFMHSVGFPNLWVMPSGPLPPNPSELLDSQVMQLFLTEIAKCGFEIIVFDTPPFLGLSDASVLASKVDGILIVADVTRANKRSLRQMKSLLIHAGIRVVGCVANKQRRSRKDIAASFYYYEATEQDGSGNNSRKNGMFSAVPETPTVSVNAFHTAGLSLSEEGEPDKNGSRSNGEG